MQEHVESIELYKEITIIRVKGRVTFDTLKATQNEFAQKTKGKKIKNILLDLKGITESDTTAIAALIDLLKYMKSHLTGDKIGLVNVPQHINSLLEISKTLPLFHEYVSEEEALKDLSV